MASILSITELYNLYGINQATDLLLYSVYFPYSISRHVVCTCTTNPQKNGFLFCSVTMTMIPDSCTCTSSCCLVSNNFFSQLTTESLTPALMDAVANLNNQKKILGTLGKSLRLALIRLPQLNFLQNETLCMYVGCIQP